MKQPLRFSGSPTSLVADVDCTADGQSLCSTKGVSGYPTIKYGDPTDLQDYQGGRKYGDPTDLKDCQGGRQVRRPDGFEGLSGW